MKFLKNPIFVGVLVVVALVLVFRNFNLASLFQRAVASKTAAAEPDAEAEEEKDSGAETLAGFDPALTGWGNDLPRRNPFSSAPVAEEAAIEDPEQTLELAATWLQDTARLAIINGGVVAEGETVAGMRVESILADRVIVSGPDGSAEIGFRASRGTRGGAVNLAPPL
jgi:hypothetical protein